MKMLPLLRWFCTLAGTALLLAACGGGSDSADRSRLTPAEAAPPAPEFIQPTTALGSSSQYAGSDPADPVSCSLDRQKKFTRAYLDEVYLWYDQIVDVDPDQFTQTTTQSGVPPDYPAVSDYFDALLVRTPDANGVAQDRFSTVIPASQAQALLASLDTTAQPQSSTQSGVVPVTKTVASPAGRNVGYIQFNAFDVGAQDALIASFRQLQAAGVQDLVLDLRANSGGFLYIAQSAASMITGPNNVGRIFEQLHYNNKRDPLTASSTMNFVDRVQVAESRFPVGTQLPQLNLPRVFVLTSNATCSASESVINSLRGVDVQVVRVGTTTCGKPYGFSEKDNCGLAYFPIEFRGTNAKGFGDYTTGFAPTCQLRDNPSVAAGGASDPLLNAALFFADNNACPANTGAGADGVQGSASPIVTSALQPNRPAWAGRMLLPVQQAH
jgi:hypothetical protein